MKKRLVTILSLVLSFVLCFSLVACGGNDDKSKQGSVKKVSISVNGAIDAVESVLNAKGFTGTASYSLSTKNTETLTESGAFDKRGSKLKLTAGEDEMIVDYQTGYVYYKGENGYTFDNELYANTFDYVQYLLASFKQDMPTEPIDVTYNKKDNTVTYTKENADSVNKYLTPLQNAYKKNKKLGALLNEYCTLLFGKDFDALYGAFEEYVKNPENTIGTLLDDLKDEGVDVEAILEMYDYTLPDDIKARPLNKVVAGAFKFVMSNFGEMLPFDLEETEGENVADDSDADEPDYEEGGGMTSMGMALIQAMLFEEVSEQEIATAMKGMSDGIAIVKNTFPVKSLVDMALADSEEAADLYTVIKDGVKLKNATMTLTLTIGDNKTITGIKVDYYVAHNYKGKAAEGSMLADNNYRATVEIAIDEYTTPTEDFVINFDPAADYKMPVTAYLYEVTDKDVYVYFETGGKTVNVGSYILKWYTPDGDVREILPEDQNSFKFDSAKSSFVFNNDLIKTAFSDNALESYLNAGFSVFGTSLEAVVFFDDDENGYAIKLMYVDDDLKALSDFWGDMAMDQIFDFIGGAGADAPDISDQVVA